MIAVMYPEITNCNHVPMRTSGVLINKSDLEPQHFLKAVSHLYLSFFD